MQFKGELFMKRLFLTITVLMLTAVAALPQSQPQSSSQQQDSKQSKQSDQNAKQNDSRLSSSDRRFVNEAAEAGMAEVAHGQLAAQRATNQEVKTFAQRMVDDHTKANQELMQLAMSKGITLPNQQSSMKSGRTDSTSATSGHQSGSTSATSGQQSGSTSTRSGQQSGSTSTTSGQQSGTTSTTGGQMTEEQSQLKGKHREAMDKLAKLSGADFDREYMRNQVKDHEKAVALFERQANSGSDADLKAFATKTLPTLREHHQMARDLAAKVGASETKATRN
jgi:putative membrane protein